MSAGFVPHFLEQRFALQLIQHGPYLGPTHRPLTGRLYPTHAVPPRKQALTHFLVEPWGLHAAEHRAQRRVVMPSFHHKMVAARMVRKVHLHG
jgi:hypothetical protein